VSQTPGPGSPATPGFLLERIAFPNCPYLVGDPVHVAGEGNREVLEVFRRAVAAAAAALFICASLLGTVSAGAAGVTITVTDINGVETFTTGGGVLCPSGSSQNFFQKFGGSGNSAAGTFHGYKVLTCADGSGTFNITYDASTVFGSPTDHGGWHLYDGTGQYAGYSGGGHLVGTYTDTGIIDLYTGRVSSK
jgi:hypothetical protein